MHGWLHILSDLAVWSAYFAIPCILIYFVLKRQDVPYRGIFWLFGAFILACGTTHLMEAIIFWNPLYRLAGLIKLLTAVVSWATVLALIPIIPRALAMRSPEQLQAEIDARRQAEQSLYRSNVELEHRVAALQASEERFRLLVDGTKDYAIFMLDPIGRITSWNPGAERVKQYRADEIIGQHFSRFYPLEDIQAGRPENELRVAASEGKYEEEGWRIRKDGSRFWASVVVTALRDDKGNLRGFSKVTRDITDKMRAEENARRLLQEETARAAAEEYASVIERQREQLRVTLTSIGDAVITTDADGLVTLLNPVAEELTGWSNADATGQPLPAVFRIINEQTRQPADNPITRVLASGQVVGLANHTLLIARDGTERPVDDSAAPILDPKGRILGVILVFRDVTARKRYEREREEADRRKDEFLAILAHELRNPLAPIRNGIQLLRATAEPAREEIRQMIERQLGQLVRLVDDLLDISRISRNRLDLRLSRIPLSSVIENAVETVRPLIDSRGHVLQIELPEQPLYLDADLTRLAQVFWNLLNNSAKYTNPGGRIKLTAKQEADNVVVSVRDTGIGFSTEAAPGLFTMFAQIDNSPERTQGGLGIGLALVKGLIEMHGGKVQAYSPGIGQGSEFVVRLPLAESVEARGSVGTPVVVAARRRVLVVDDNRDAAASLTMILSMWGHEARTAHDGLEAVELADAFRPDVILLDIGLPKLNGYDVCRRIRGQSWGRNVLIAAVTGWGQDKDKLQADNAGFDCHFTKPVDLSVLERVLAHQSPRGA